MCCIMQVRTNCPDLMDEALREWAADTQPPNGPWAVLKSECVFLNAEKGRGRAVFTLEGSGHHVSPESWVAAVKGVTTLYNWGLKLNYDAVMTADDFAPLWVAEQLSDPCPDRTVGEGGHAIDLTAFCWAAGPMGVLKAEAMVMSDRQERVGRDNGCTCGCNDDCGDESRVREG